MNITLAMPLTATMLPYSAMKMTSQRKPEYSVWKPATSSLSASARSNGARFTLAIAQVKSTQEVMNVNRSCSTSQLVNQPACMLPIVIKFIVPQMTTGMITHIPIGTS